MNLKGENMNRKVGKVSWSSPAVNTNDNRGDKDAKKIPFLSLEGFGKSWKVRVLSEDPLRYWCHFTTDKNNKTVKLNCTLDDSCPVQIEKTKTTCAGNQADARYYLKVLDRSDSQVKVLDVGKQIVSAIGNLIDNADWGHCRGYDVTVKKGEKGAMPLYTVEPSPHRALSDVENALANNSEDPDHVDFIDLESRIQPLTADTIGKILRGADSVSKLAGTRPTGANVTPMAKVVASTSTKVTPKAKSEDDEFEVNWDET